MVLQSILPLSLTDIATEFDFDFDLSNPPPIEDSPEEEAPELPPPPPPPGANDLYLYDDANNYYVIPNGTHSVSDIGESDLFVYGVLNINNLSYNYLDRSLFNVKVPTGRVLHLFDFNTTTVNSVARYITSGTYLKPFSHNILSYYFSSSSTNLDSDGVPLLTTDKKWTNAAGVPTIALSASSTSLTVNETASITLTSTPSNDFSESTPKVQITSNPESSASLSTDFSTLTIIGANRNKTYVVAVQAIIDGYDPPITSNQVSISVKEYPPPPVWSSIPSITGTVEQSENKVWESVDLRLYVSYTNILTISVSSKSISPTATYNASTGKVSFTTSTGTTVSGSITVQAVNTNATTGLSRPANATFSVNVTHNTPVASIFETGRTPNMDYDNSQSPVASSTIINFFNDTDFSAVRVKGILYLNENTASHGAVLPWLKVKKTYYWSFAITMFTLNMDTSDGPKAESSFVIGTSSGNIKFTKNTLLGIKYDLPNTGELHLEHTDLTSRDLTTNEISAKIKYFIYSDSSRLSLVETVEGNIRLYYSFYVYYQI